MRVASPELPAVSTRSLQAQQARTENLLQRTLAQRLSTPELVPVGRPVQDTALLSDTGKQLAAQPEAQQKVLQVLKDLFGISNVASMDLKIEVNHLQAVGSASAERSTNTGSSSSYDYQDSYTELSHTSLQASGSITLADGRSFALDLSYSRTELFHSERSMSVTRGEQPEATEASETRSLVLDPLFTQLSQLAHSRDHQATQTLSVLLKALSTDLINQRFADFRAPASDPRLQAFGRSGELLNQPAPENRIDHVA